MEESGLYTARMRVVEAMERGIPWHETAKLAEIQISQSTAYRLRQRMSQGGEQALREGSRDIQPNCEVKSESFWKRSADKPLTRPAVRSKHSCQDFGPISPCLMLAQDDFEVTVAKQWAKATADIARPGGVSVASEHAVPLCSTA
jgi:hypothetical protein